MTAPDLSPAEAAIVAEFEAAETPPEVLREQVARAFAETVGRATTRVRDYDLADAALAVLRGQQDPAVQRVLELAAELERDCAATLDENPSKAAGLLAAADRITAALSVTP